MKLVELRTFLFLTLCLIYFNPFYFLPFSDAPEFLWNPVWYLAPLFQKAPSAVLIATATIGFSISLAASLFRKTHALGLAAAAVLSLFLLSLNNSYGCFLHPENNIVLMLISMSVLAARKHTEIETSQVVSFLLVMMYFQAGVSKVLNWDGTLSFGFILENGAYHALELNHHWRGTNSPSWMFDLREAMLQQKQLLKFFSAVTVVIELAAPLALLRNRLGQATVLALFVLQLSFIFSLQLPVFIPALFPFVFFLRNSK